MKKINKKMKKILKVALKETAPVFLGYLFVGIAFGLFLQKSGYNFLWACLISLIVYAGSMQFVLVGFLSGGVGMISIIVTTLAVNSRHVFYGLSFIEQFKTMGKKRFYMMFSLTDETYSLLCSTKNTDETDNKQLYFLISLLNQSYWIIGSLVGSVMGHLIVINTSGIEFAMTALFVSIFVEQWIAKGSHIPTIIGLLCGTCSLIILGPSNFLFPALIVSVLLLLGFKAKIQPEKTLSEEDSNNHSSKIKEKEETYDFNN